MSNKEILTKNLSVIKSALGNKRLFSQNMPYMKLFKIKNMLYTSAYTESIDLYLENFPVEFKGKGNYDYKYFSNAVTNLSENIAIRNYRNETGISISDGESTVMLRNFVTQEDDGDASIEKYKTIIEETGYVFNASHYLEILNYLNKVSNENPEDTTYHSGMIYMAKDNTLLIGTNYLLRVNYISQLEYAITTDEAKVISAFLKSKMDANESASVAYCSQSKELYFKIGNSYLVVYNVTQEIPTRPTELFNNFKYTTSVEIPSTQLLRYLNLTSVFLPKNIDEVVCEVKKGKGYIGRDNSEIGTSKGVFCAENCPNFSVLLKLEDIQRILKNIPLTNEHITKIEFNLEEDTAYFQHPYGDAFLSISVESYVPQETVNQ